MATMPTAEMRKASLKPGYWFVNVAALGEDPNWTEQVAPHVQTHLFGYEPNRLLAKQYKKKSS